MTRRPTVRPRAFAPRLLALIVLVGLSLLGLAATATADSQPTAWWHERTVDVFVDGVPRVDARVFAPSAGDRDLLAVSVPDAPEIWLVDQADGSTGALPADRMDISRDEAGVGRALLELTTGPSTDASLGRPLPAALEALDGWILRDDAHDDDARNDDGRGPRSVMIVPHAGPVGPLDHEALWSIVPSWRDRAEATEPDSAVVDALATVERPTRLVVYFGTWCGDSRRGVPPLLETVRQARERGAPLEIELIAVARRFDDPLGDIREHALTNVPTVLVRQGRREIGRVVETPRGESLAADVAAILAGTPNEGDGLFRSTDRRVASGVYRVRDEAGRDAGSETFALFETEDGDRRLHAVSRHGLRTIELWATLEGGRVTFAELTETDGEIAMRSRAWRRDGKLTGWTRGDVAGVVHQRLDLPASTTFVLPSLAARGLAFGAPSSAPTRSILRYAGAGPGILESAVVRSEGVVMTEHAGRTLATPKLTAALAGRDTDHGVATYWLHPGYDVPLRVETTRGDVAELVDLQEGVSE